MIISRLPSDTRLNNALSCTRSWDTLVACALARRCGGRYLLPDSARCFLAGGASCPASSEAFCFFSRFSFFSFTGSTATSATLAASSSPAWSPSSCSDCESVSSRKLDLTPTIPSKKSKKSSSNPSFASSLRSFFRPFFEDAPSFPSNSAAVWSSRSRSWSRAATSCREGRPAACRSRGDNAAAASRGAGVLRLLEGWDSASSWLGPWTCAGASSASESSWDSSPVGSWSSSESRLLVSMGLPATILSRNPKNSSVSPSLANSFCNFRFAAGFVAPSFFSRLAVVSISRARSSSCAAAAARGAGKSRATGPAQALRFVFAGAVASSGLGTFSLRFFSLSPALRLVFFSRSPPAPASRCPCVVLAPFFCFLASLAARSSWPRCFCRCAHSS
mmetsp:Transcript_21438/g.52057  ORF Transcript_21438/g.52057 Transcript_21438/m.52057 type:complete len:390 (+) Transcript_21438:1578-2747(+)